jgi:hypothetical protein
MFDDNERPYNASSILAVVHLDADIRSTVIVGASDPAYNGSNLTERMAARSLFVAKHTPYVVFGQSPIMMFVKIKSSHPISVPPGDGSSLPRDRSSVLVIASHEFAI